MRRLCLVAILLGEIAVESALACDEPLRLDGFQTCADVAKAEQEGALAVAACRHRPGA